MICEATVRARDGRSILDRGPGGTEPAKGFAADPDRLHAAIAVLADHGLFGDGIGSTAIWFSGRRADVEAAFGVHAFSPAPP